MTPFVLILDNLASMRLQFEVGPGLKVEQPAKLAKYIRTSYPDELVTGSDMDLLVCDIEEKLTAEYLRLENGRLAWEQAVAETLETLQKHVERYELELHDESLRINDTSVIEGG
jgi:hypothetical protein